MPVQDDNFITWMIGGVSTLFLAAIGWMNGRVEKRVSKDVFEVSMKSIQNSIDANTKWTDQQTQSIKDLHVRVDGKQDKG